MDCEICKNELELEVYLGLEETLFLCEHCIYEEELKAGPK